MQLPPSGSGFPPSGGNPYAQPSFPPFPPPPPPREKPNNTTRNLLIGGIAAVVLIVPLTGWLIASSMRSKSTDEETPSATASQAQADPPPADPPPADTQPAMPTEPPASADPRDRGENPDQQAGTGICCCDGSVSKCTTLKKGCCKKKGGVCPCGDQGQGQGQGQGNRRRGRGRRNQYQ